MSSGEYNILLLGETGVGKSTFINAFANYLTFDTLDEALEAPEVTTLIPAKFSVTDDKLKAIEIVSGTDENECFITGASATQLPRIYKFQVGDFFVRLIDTPGVGDTRGIKKDEQNFDNLLTIIGQVQHLHAICILLKPNNSRLTVLFEYCFKQLLSRLERSAADNIVFLFTNSRTTSYRPGDTLPPLLELLDEIQSKSPKLKIPFGKDNVFCMDNEAFRFLLAKKRGMQFSDRDKEDFDACWRASTDVCMSLLHHMSHTKPHKIQDTISVNEARRLILTLSEPLAIMTKNIEDNMNSLNKREEELRDGSKSLDELQGKLYVPVIKIKSSPLSYPRTVCADAACTETTLVENVKQNHYKRACHDHCTLKKIAQDVVGTPNIRECDAFQRKDNCKECGHIYMLHLHIYYITEAYSDHIRDTSVEANIQSKRELMDKVAKKINELKARRAQLIWEKEVIQTSMAKFAHFLKNSAMFIYNDKYTEYIQMLIIREKSKSEDVDWYLIESYELLISTYEEMKHVLAEAHQSGSSDFSGITAEQIIETVKVLYNLPICGEDIKGLYQTVRDVYNVEILRKAEKVCHANALKKYVKSINNTNALSPSASS